MLAEVEKNHNEGELDKKGAMCNQRACSQRSCSAPFYTYRQVLSFHAPLAVQSIASQVGMLYIFSPICLQCAICKNLLVFEISLPTTHPLKCVLMYLMYC